jgi:hypothetical protein
MPRLFGRPLVPYACWFFLTLAGFSAPVFASDAAKAPPPKEKEPNYAEEDKVQKVAVARFTNAF